MVVELVRETVSRAARLLEQSDRPHPLEKDLKAAVKDAAAEVVAERQLELTVSDAEHKAKLVGFPGVGRYDVAIVGTDGRPTALLELKWGAGTLLQIAWDVAKLAVTHREYLTTTFIVAGAPVANWETERGRELFDRRTRDAGDFMVVYDDLFEFSRRNQISRPRRLPSVIETHPCAEAALTVAGQPWKIRATEVRASGGESVNLDEAGREISRDRGDRFLSHADDVIWHTHPDVQPSEGRDLSGSDRVFHADMLDDDQHDAWLAERTRRRLEERTSTEDQHPDSGATRDAAPDDRSS